VGEDERDVKNHEFEKLLRQPNPLNSGNEFKRDTVIQRLINGNAVWWMNRTSWQDKPTELWNIPYNKIEPVPDGKSYLSGYKYYPGDGKPAIMLPTWQICHFKDFNPFSPYHGLSMIEALAITLHGDDGMRKTLSRQYTKFGGAPQSILAFKDFVNNEAWEDIKVEKQNAAMRNEMMMLRGVGDGVSWMSRAVSSKDAEFIETLRQNMTDVFNMVAPGLLAALDSSAKYSNAEAGRRNYEEMTLYTYAGEFSAKITSEIMPAYGRNLIAEFEDPRTSDRAMELQEVTTFSQFFTIDEVREQKYQLDPIGDERGKLLVAEVKVKASPFGQVEEQPAEAQQPPDEVENEMEDVEEEQEDPTAKAVIDDLMILRKMALKGKTDKVAAFKSAYIPAKMLADIRKKLEINSDKGAIVSIFDAKIRSLQPKPKVDATVILRGIEAGVKALELKG